MADDLEMQVPDPEGPPTRRARKQRTVAGILASGTMVVVGGAAALMVVATAVTPTSGALRSQRVTWQERQREIAEEVVQQKAASAINAAEANESTVQEPDHE
jgi:hypothetical protein